MVATVTLNPLVTTNALGSFSTYSDGVVQGTAFDSPNTRFNLAGGILATAETVPMWGGIAISELIPPTTSNGVLGSTIARATALANITGFSVFDQAHNGLTTPQSPVPLFASGMGINFYRLGSGARLALQIDPALVSLDGGLITQNVSWDYANGKIIAYDGSNKLPVTIQKIIVSNCKIVSYNAGTGNATWVNGACAIVTI